MTLNQLERWILTFYDIVLFCGWSLAHSHNNATETKSCNPDVQIPGRERNELCLKAFSFVYLQQLFCVPLYICIAFSKYSPEVQSCKFKPL